MTATDLLSVAPDWVTLRSTTEDGHPVVVLIDRAVASAAPYAEFTQQCGVAVQYGPTEDGLPTAQELPSLRAVEQALVDAAAGEARLVAVMTIEGVREWVLYARSTAWALPFLEAGLSVVTGDDPTWHGLKELSGRV